MGANHPVSFCKDYQGGRSFYTGLGNTPRGVRRDADHAPEGRDHLGGRHGSDPVYSDCGATVLRNYQQTKIGSPPNLQEPIGFDQLPDGRILQTDRLGSLRLHNPATGITTVIANFTDPALPLDAAHLLRRRGRPLRPGGGRELRDQQVGLPVLLAADGRRTSSCPTGEIVTQTTPNTNPPNTAASKTAWDPYVGYHQLSRFKFVEDANGPRLDFDAPSSRSSGSR